MNCEELQASLVEIEDGSGAEQRAHLKNCAECSALVAELNLIIASAAKLRGVDEPSPRVWNSIELALRQEGLIRPQRPNRSLLPSPSSRWGWARWLVPAAAVLLVALGLYVRQQPPTRQLTDNTTQPAGVTPDIAVAGLNDEDLLQEVATLSPVSRAEYTDDLQRVNAYIRDAKSVVDADPNDDEARHVLLDAYQQKAMLFELAMDRSLP